MQDLDTFDFLALTDKQFEELCFDLLALSGFEKLEWRQGGADSGRDIQGTFVSANPLDIHNEETWFFECKHHKTGISPDQLNGKIAWADAEKPKHLVFIVSSYL